MVSLNFKSVLAPCFLMLTAFIAVLELIRVLVSQGHSTKDILVMSPYVAMCAKLTESLGTSIKIVSGEEFEHAMTAQLPRRLALASQPPPSASVSL